MRELSSQVTQNRVLGVLQEMHVVVLELDVDGGVEQSHQAELDVLLLAPDDSDDLDHLGVGLDQSAGCHYNL